MPKSKSLTVKELESRIDSNGNLDLSLLKLTEISFLKKLKNSKFVRKIKSIDLSDNKINFDSSERENILTINNEDILELCPIPEVIRNQIEFINFSNNHIENIPSYLGLLKNLRKLDFYANDVKSLNLDVFGSVSKLSWLDITGNENLDEEGKGLISRSNDHSDTARNVVTFYSEKLTKASKIREKRKKKQDKQNEKAAKELKLKQKEQRRKEYEEKQKIIEEEKMRAALEKNESEDDSGNESDTDGNENEKANTSENHKSSKETSNHSQEKSSNSISSIIFNLFTSIYAIIIWTFLLPFRLIKLIFTLLITLLTFVIKCAILIAVFIGIGMVGCNYLSDGDYEICYNLNFMMERYLNFEI